MVKALCIHKQLSSVSMSGENQQQGCYTHPEVVNQLINLQLWGQKTSQQRWRAEMEEQKDVTESTAEFLGKLRRVAQLSFLWGSFLLTFRSRNWPDPASWPFCSAQDMKSCLVSPEENQQCYVVQPQTPLPAEVWDIFLKSPNCGGSTPSAVSMLNTCGCQEDAVGSWSEWILAPNFSHQKSFLFHLLTRRAFQLKTSLVKVLMTQWVPTGVFAQLSDAFLASTSRWKYSRP